MSYRVRASSEAERTSLEQAAGRSKEIQAGKRTERGASTYNGPPAERRLTHTHSYTGLDIYILYWIIDWTYVKCLEMLAF